MLIVCFAQVRTARAVVLCACVTLVAGVAWYPVDTGLFVSGSYDSDVKLWDTNE